MIARTILSIVVSLVVAGCTITGEQVRDTVGEGLYSVGAKGVNGKRLIAMTTLEGYLVESGAGTHSAVRLLTGMKGAKPIAVDPVAIGAGAEGVYVVDASNAGLTRFRWQSPGGKEKGSDPAKDNAGLGRSENVRLGQISEIEEPSDLFVTQTGDLFIADAKGSKVVRYDKDGKRQQDYSDELNLRRPVAVTVDARGLRIVVADAFYDRLIVFNPRGMSLYGIGQRGDEPGGFRNIRGMVQGRDGLLYVMNGMRPDIQVYGLDSTYVGSFGAGVLEDPAGMAVDDENRIYVSDRFLHKILVFSNRKLVEKYGRFGKKPGEFNQPARMAFHHGYLYVADSKNSRIQAFRVVPEKLIEKDGEGGDAK
ncbi:MAG: NHL repeat-containing protein [Alphaproteobacteria bacterium]